jgi:hypothetical protein
MRNLLVALFAALFVILVNAAAFLLAKLRTERIAVHPENERPFWGRRIESPDRYTAEGRRLRRWFFVVELLMVASGMAVMAMLAFS